MVKEKLGLGIVVTSGKGGVGKTTTSANIGTGLAILGYSVVVVDADIGLRNLDVIMGLENRIVYDLVDVIDGHCKLNQALIKDKREKELYLLPAAQIKDKTAVSPDQMFELVQELKERFDYVIMDSPAGIEQGFENSIAGTDIAIIVTTPEISAVRDADRVIGILEAREIKDVKLLVNRVKPEMISRGDMMDKQDIIDILAIDLIGIVPDDEDVVISANRGEPVVFDETSLAGKAFMNISKRLSGDKVELLDLDLKKEGKFSQIMKLLFSR